MSVAAALREPLLDDAPARAAAIAARPEPATCVHCGLPAPAPVVDDEQRVYCCTGCAIVARTLRGHGLERFYAVRDADAPPPAPARATGRSYAELDDPAHQRLHVEVGADGVAHAALYLEDLRCSACVWLVEATPRCLPGVREVRVDLGRGKADVTFDPARVRLSQIAGHLDRVGHPPHPYRAAVRDLERRRQDRALLIKLGVAGAAVGNLMLLAAALYAGLFSTMAAADVAFFRWASMLVAVPALGFAASPFFRTALGSLRARRMHLDLPLSIGIVVGLGWGAANVVRGAGEIYFDSLAMLVFLLLVSRWVVASHQRRASSATEMLLALTPSRARRLAPTASDAPTDAELREVPIEAIAVGDRVLVRAGEVIPVDGEVAAGRSSLDAGLLSGESRPIEVGPAAEVFAGTLNLVAPLIVVARTSGEATRVGRMVARIDELSRQRATIERTVDRLAGRFVAVVMAAAALTIVGWAPWSVGAGLEHAMALLVVTCPCALALATPLAVAVALGRAARRGILIKGLHALETVATPGTIVLDKTGTLTEGRLEVRSWIGDPGARALAAAVERGSAHPIARALAALVPDAPLATGLHEDLGGGIRGDVDGRAVAVGAVPWQRLRGTPIPTELEAAIAELADRGESPVAIAVDDRVVAVAGLGDPLRPGVADDLATLRAAGWRLELLSGDDPRVAVAIGAALGLPAEACRGGVSPEGKLAHVRALRDGGATVVMVGDGVNDAAAMTAASCGIAVAGAAEIALEAADVLVRAPGLGGVVATVAGARATLATIRRSLRISLVYNLVAGSLAAGGVIHPLLAAALMPLSSLSVLASSMRSRAFREVRP
ncbi:MAG: heavy metal translocating P-type ATPase [Kofleriaceae bacterium]